MNFTEHLFINDGELPLERPLGAYSFTSIFRKIAFIGDSLSSGEFETVDKEGKKGYHDLYEYSWGQYIARQRGLTAYNFSRGGMTAEEYMTSFAEERGFFNPELRAQAYVIALGVNDILNQNRPLGTLDDINPDDYTKNAPTFVGYYAAIISKYKEISPDAKFFLVNFPSEGGEREEKREERAKATIDVLYGLAEHFENTYIIDLYKYGPIHNKRFKDSFYLHTHLNPMGYIVTAELIDGYIDYIVRKHPEDFFEVGFINSGIKYKFD